MTRPVLLALVAAPLLAGCVTATATERGFLSDYSRLQPVEGNQVSNAKAFADQASVAAIDRLFIAPTVVSLPDGTEAPGAINVVAREIDRELCLELAETFTITEDPRDPTIRAAVTDIQRTNAAASVISAGISQFIPGPGSVRLPVGLGGLAAEAELIDPTTGRQLAALSWARRAQLAFSDGSLSEVGDAHRMAEPFADAVARTLRPEAADNEAADNTNDQNAAPAGTTSQAAAGESATVTEAAAAVDARECARFSADGAARWVAARLTGLHFVPGDEPAAEGGAAGSQGDGSPEPAGRVEAPALGTGATERP